MFSKRHYQWLARFAGANLSESAVQNLAAELAANNPRFNLDRFMRAYETAKGEHARALHVAQGGI